MKHLPYEEIIKAYEKQNAFIIIDNKPFQLGLFRNYIDNAKNLFMKKLFICYSKHDAELKNEFIKHLSVLKANNYISPWHDEEIKPGEKWDKVIFDNLKNADIVIFLVTHNLLASEYVMDKELIEALKGVQKGNQKIVPVILDYCDWEDSPLGKFQAANKKAVEIEIMAYTNINEGFFDVVENLKKIIKE